MRIDWPLALLALLLVPLALLALRPLERRRARYAVHYTNIEVLAAVAGRRASVAALRAAGSWLALPLTCALAALARPEAADCRSRASRPRSPSRSTSRARCRADDVKPTRLAPRRRRCGASSTGCPSDTASASSRSRPSRTSPRR